MYIFKNKNIYIIFPLNDDPNFNYLLIIICN